LKGGNVVKRTIQTVVLVFILAATGCTCALKRAVPTATIPQSALPTPSTTPLPLVATAVPPTVAPSLPTAQPTSQLGADYLGEKKQGGALGGTWTLKDVRVGVHEDRFRVVIEMNEPRDHAPFFEAIQVDNAAVPFPTGHDPTWGAARIDLVISDLYLFDYPVGERLPIPAPENPVVTRVDRYPTESDAHVGFSIGLRTPAAYVAYYLTDPVRVVIDVLYP
jgi:hypothetical protein